MATKNPIIGQRIELHPGCDLWMRGARYGTIIGTRPTKQDMFIIELDKIPGRKFSAPADRFTFI